MREVSRGAPSGAAGKAEKFHRPSALTTIFAAELVNNAGSGISSIAVPLLVYGKRGIVAAALIFVVTELPALALGLHAGVLADRMDRRLLVVLASLAQGGLLVCIPVIYAAAGVWGLGVVLLAARTIGVFARPALSAMMTSLAGGDYQRTFGKKAALEFLAQALGPAIGGALVGAIGAQYAIGLDGLSFMCAGVLVLSMRPMVTAASGRQNGSRHLTRDLIEGLAFIRGSVPARALTLYWCVSIAAVPVALLAAIPYIRTFKAGTAFDYGAVVTAYAAGSIVSSLVAGKLRFRGGRRRWLLGAGLGYGAVNLVMLGTPSIALFGMLWLIWGLAYGPEEVLTQSMFAETVPEELLGRSYSVIGVAMSAASIVGYAVAGAVISELGPSQAMALAGAVFIVATTWAFGWSSFGRTVLAATEEDRAKRHN